MEVRGTGYTTGIVPAKADTESTSRDKTLKVAVKAIEGQAAEASRAAEEVKTSPTPVKEPTPQELFFDKVTDQKLDDPTLSESEKEAFHYKRQEFIELTRRIPPKEWADIEASLCELLTFITSNEEIGQRLGQMMLAESWYEIDLTQDVVLLLAFFTFIFALDGRDERSLTRNELATFLYFRSAVIDNSDSLEGIEFLGALEMDGSWNEATKLLIEDSFYPTNDGQIHLPFNEEDWAFFRSEIEKLPKLEKTLMHLPLKAVRRSLEGETSSIEHTIYSASQHELGSLGYGREGREGGVLVPSIGIMQAYLNTRYRDRAERKHTKLAFSTESLRFSPVLKTVEISHDPYRTNNFPVRINPVLGLSSREDIRENGPSKMRDMALYFPGVTLPRKADGFSATPRQFTFHDFYHATVVSAIPEHVLDLSYRSALIMEQILKDETLSKAQRHFANKLWSGFVDNEFSGFREDIVGEFDESLWSHMDLQAFIYYQGEKGMLITETEVIGILDRLSKKIIPTLSEEEISDLRADYEVSLKREPVLPYFRNFIGILPSHFLLSKIGASSKADEVKT